MKNLHNIEKSVFRKGEYVGYTEGPTVRIRKQGSYWLAVTKDRAIYTTTLAQMSKELDKL